MTRWNKTEYEAYMEKYNRDIKPFHPDTMEADEGKESILQGKIVNWARSKGYPCLSFRQTSRAKGVLLPGWPDITLALPNGRTVYIELKNKKGRLSEDQKNMALMLMQLKHEWYEVRSFKRFLGIVENKK